MPDIIHRIGINGAPAQVFQALTTQEGLTGWWTKDAKAEARSPG